MGILFRHQCARKAFLFVMKNPIKVLDYEPAPIDRFRHNWALYACTVEFADGSQKQGSIQGDEHIWAWETFEEDP